MKRLGRFLVIGILVVVGCNDTELGEPIDNQYFYKLFGTYYNDHINAVKQDQNGGLLIAGYSQREEAETWSYISKALPSGMLDWDTIISENSDSKAFDIYEVQNLNQIIVSCSQEYTEDSTWLYLLSFSSDGNISDSVSIKILATEILNVQIIYQNNGLIRLLSQIVRRDPDTKIDYGFLLLHDLSATGNLEEAFSMELNQQVQGKVIVKYHTEQSVFLSATVQESSNGNPVNSTDVRIMYINENVVEWDKNFGEPGISESCFDLKIENNELIIGGNYLNPVQTSQQIYLLTINLDGEEQTSTIIGADNIESSISCSSFTINDSNNYVFCGDIVTGNGTKDILFLETKPNGANVRISTYGSRGISAGLNLGKSIYFLAEENVYLMAGVMETINNYDICIFKLNREGEWISE